LGNDDFKGLWKRSLFEIQFKEEYTDTVDGSRPKDELRRQIIDAMKNGASRLALKGDATGAAEALANAEKTADKLLTSVTDAANERTDHSRRA
jgi:hypothetical protein